jgi:hypothetical protein
MSDEGFFLFLISSLARPLEPVGAEPHVGNFHECGLCDGDSGPEAIAAVLLRAGPLGIVLELDIAPAPLVKPPVRALVENHWEKRLECLGSCCPLQPTHDDKVAHQDRQHPRQTKRLALRQIGPEEGICGCCDKEVGQVPVPGQTREIKRRTCRTRKSENK